MSRTQIQDAIQSPVNPQPIYFFVCVAEEQEIAASRMAEYKN